MIEINGKVYRNLQEQVAENVKDIEDLQEAVADLPDSTYSKTQIDSKDAATLQAAKNYADLGDNSTLQNAIQFATTKANEAKAYTDEKTLNDVKIIKLITYPTTLTEEQQYLFEHYDVIFECAGLQYIRSSVDPIRFKPSTFYLYYDTHRLVTNILELTYQQDGTIYVDLLQNANITQPLATASDLASKQDTLVWGTNIKNINNIQLSGSGSIDVTELGYINVEYGTTTPIQLTTDQVNQMVKGLLRLRAYTVDEISSERTYTYFTADAWNSPWGPAESETTFTNVKSPDSGRFDLCQVHGIYNNQDETLTLSNWRQLIVTSSQLYSHKLFTGLTSGGRFITEIVNKNPNVMTDAQIKQIFTDRNWTTGTYFYPIVTNPQTSEGIIYSIAYNTALDKFQLFNNSDGTTTDITIRDEWTTL